MLVTGPAPLSLDGAAVGHGLPRRLIPLDEVRAIVLHPATGRAARDAVWRHVVGEARSGAPAWVVGAVGLALPGLWRMAGGLAEGYRRDVADLHGAILAGFVTGLHRVDPDRPGVITRLWWATYRAGLLARYARDGVVSMPLPVWESAPPPAPWGHPDLVLADAVAKGVLSPLAAELIGRSRLEDLTLKQAAAELGVGVQAAYKVRRRGERRLVAAIASGDVEHRLSNPGPASGLFSARGSNTHPASTTGQAGAPAGGGSGHEPAGVRGPSTGSDGTPDTETTAHLEGGAFCGSAHQPPPRPETSASRPEPGDAGPGTSHRESQAQTPGHPRGQSRGPRRGQRRGGRDVARRRRPGRPGGQP